MISKITTPTLLEDSEPTLIDLDLIEKLSEDLLKATYIIANTELSEAEVLEEIGFEHYKIEDQFEVIAFILAKTMLAFGCKLSYRHEELYITWFGKHQSQIERPSVFKDRDLSEPVSDIFFNRDVQYLCEEVPNNCSHSWLMRKKLLTTIQSTVGLMSEKFPGDNGEIYCEYFFYSEDVVNNFNSESRDIYTKEIMAELEKFPESSAHAMKTPRMCIAKKINEQQPYLDLMHMQAEEVLSILVQQLEEYISSYISRAVTIELVDFCDSAPENYMDTKMPDEDTLKAYHSLKVRKKLPKELQYFIGKYSTTPCFYKHVTDPGKSIVIYENVGLCSITQANQFVIHIGERKR